MQVFSVIKAKKKYYPQTLLEECKYEQEKIKMENFIDGDLSDESDNYSMDETESDNDESNNLLKAKKRILIAIKN